MFFDPGMIGRALKCDIHRQLQPMLLCCFDQTIKVTQRTQFMVDGLVSTICVADRPRTSNLTLCCNDIVVTSLAKCSADRVNRWQIEHVEAHLYHLRQKALYVLQCAVATVLSQRSWE